MHQRNNKVAVIAPTSMLHWVNEWYRERFHLVLTQYYWADAKYREFYNKRREEGDFLILDNGAAELKHSADSSKVIDACLQLRPHVVIAPDVIHDCDQTYQLTTEFLDRWFKELYEAGIEIMAVPQGSSKIEWLNCFVWFNKEPRISWLGISMFYHEMFEGRLGALEYIRSEVTKPCHLLGLWDSPYTLRLEGRYDFVKSADTAKAVEFALEGLSMRQWQQHKHIDDDWYFELPKIEWEGKKDLIMRNVIQLKDVFGGSIR